MKTWFNKTFILLSGLIVLMACEKEEDRAILYDGASVTLAGTTSSALFDRENAEEEAISFSWTLPEFGFRAAISYTLQVGVVGNDFADAVVILSTKELEASVTVGALNQKLLDLGLSPDEEADVQFRVISSVGDQVGPVISNPHQATFVPYATAFPPIYMIGEALKGWDVSKAVEVKTIAPNKYQTVAEFHQNGSFRFFSEASWEATNQYNWTYFADGTVDPSFENADDGDINLRFVAETGFYQITIDLKEKIIELEAVEKPTLFMIGEALQGWDLAKAVELEWIKDGVFETTTTFKSGETFRFFEKADWSTGFGNYPFFETGEVDPLLENAEDGDKNFNFLGETGQYKITVDLPNLKVDMEKI